MKPAEKYRAWKAHRPEKPIFRTILFSMMAVLLAEVILLSTGIGLTNVSGRLNQNAKQIVNMQVRNRASYLQDMLIRAQELTDISTTINNLTQQMLQDGTISLDTMDQSSEAADPLMEAAAPYLVSALRARPVTGIFLVINTHDLAEKEVGSPMPSVYLRDLDPDARPSDRNTDLMLERSSAAVVKALGITTDKSWSTALNYRGLTNGGFVRTVFQTAWEDDEKLDAADYGRWLTQTYKLTGDERTAIAYSQPLILPDGTVYGVIGVEILTSYLETKMPYQELQDGGRRTGCQRHRRGRGKDHLPADGRRTLADAERRAWTCTAATRPSPTKSGCWWARCAAASCSALPAPCSRSSPLQCSSPCCWGL